VEILIKHCAGILSQHGYIFLVFFLAGLTGGVTHCLAMCGTFVACQQTTCKSSSCGKNIFSELGLSYHFGRLTTYGALGFLSAFLSMQIASLSIWPWISASMLVIAGMMFVISSLPNCKHSVVNFTGKLTYIKGVLLGFLPCGLLYAALMMAATTANPFVGTVAMWLFVIGTIPALLFASFGVRVISLKWQDIMQKIGRAFMVFNGLSLFVMAVRMIR